MLTCRYVSGGILAVENRSQTLFCLRTASLTSNDRATTHDVSPRLRTTQKTMNTNNQLIQSEQVEVAESEDPSCSNESPISRMQFSNVHWCLVDMFE
ncbi:MAG: hypothetical protein GFH27_549379n10 [Chloroflexi bacterium AL-W]|nr:hypothetical protein [Chloroflexi bacterium AL-N1]NOK71134.1 hypothetical protein [Chloroflexi bacterium AL-N10]NOK78600.1 hypothetical protein [Chloroflexi bacterium AL-N5]NOK85896.1 hypothetical protein [Chloroflexi bacterium AL-W]NOK92871.1 hypothetical protein [Chloroflexi bacterium AL-N15]